MSKQVVIKLFLNKKQLYLVDEMVEKFDKLKKIYNVKMELLFDVDLDKNANKNDDIDVYMFLDFVWSDAKYYLHLTQEQKDTLCDKIHDIFDDKIYHPIMSTGLHSLNVI